VKAAGPAPARWSAAFTPEPLLIVAHGSVDPRFGEVVSAVAAQVRERAPDLDVRVGYLDHGPPHVADVAEPGAVAVPLLLSAGYHVRVDLPAQAPDVVVAAAVGPDPLLAAALADRLGEAGYDGEAPVTLAAAGSADERSRADVRLAAAQLAGRLGVSVEVAYVAAGEPRLSDRVEQAVATYLLAPGRFADQVAACGARVVSAPIGAHPAVADLVLARYRSALARD
jgi:sirohydrochlorin ferrochelatase